MNCFLKIRKTSLKLSRSYAIFEFSSSNSNVSLHVEYDCRAYKLLRPDDLIITNSTTLNPRPDSRPNLTTYFTFLLVFAGGHFTCAERGLSGSLPHCTTTIEGK